MFLGVFLGPCGVSVLVSDVDNVPVVRHRAGADDAAVLGDDVAAEEHECGLGDGACGVKRFLPPVPSFLDDVGVECVLVGVEVVDEEYIGPDGILA